MENPILATTTTSNPNVFQEAYEQLLPELKAMDPDALIHINLDVQTAVTTAFGALPEIRALRPELLKNLPLFDLAKFDKLETAAFALSHAQTLYFIASQPPDDLQALSNEATALRETLITDARALAHRGQLDGKPLEDLKGPFGYRNLASHLQVLAQLFHENWTRIVGKTSVLPTELDRATVLASRILVAVGLREQSPGLIEASGEIRQRAFTLFAQTYDHARRAVTFLRWEEGDAEQVAPSLYAGRSSARRKDQKPSTDVPTTPPSPPAPPTAQGPAISGKAAALVNPFVTDNERQPIPPGYPGSDPFTH